MKDIFKPNNKYNQLAYSILIFVVTLCMSIGYSAVSNVILNISNTAVAKVPEHPFIINATLSDNTDADLDHTNIRYDDNTLANINLELSKTNPNSSVTYTVTIYNPTDDTYFFDDVLYQLGYDTYSNEFITYDLDGISRNDTIDGKESKTFDITFHYEDNELQDSNDLTALLNFKMFIPNFISKDWAVLADLKEEYNSDSPVKNIQTITFYSNDSSFSGDAIDVSEKQDGSILLYKVLNPETEKYDLMICSNDKIFFPEDSSYLFAHLEDVNEIDFNDSIDTRFTKDMSYMYYYTGYDAETFELDLSDFETNKVENMSSMFLNTASNAETFELDLSSFNTSNVTDMHGMFFEAGKESTAWSIGNLHNFDTSKVTDMEAMFGHLGANIENFELDLSSFDTHKVTNMSDMFVKCPTLSNIYVGEKWSTQSVTNSINMFTSTTKLPHFDINYPDATYAKSKCDGGYLTVVGEVCQNILARNWAVIAGIKEIIMREYHIPPQSSLATMNESSIQSITFYANDSSFTGDAIDVSQAQDGRILLYSELDDDTYRYDLKICSNEKIYFPVDSSYLFSYFENLNNLDFNNSIDTTLATNMESMFEYTANTAESIDLDLTEFDTSNVTNMAGMFAGTGTYAERVSFNLSSFNTSKVTTMMDMFSDEKYLSDVVYVNKSTEFDEVNVTKLSYKHIGTYYYEPYELDISNFDTSNVTDMSWMFRSNDRLSKILVSSSWNTDNVNSGINMFYNSNLLPIFDYNYTNIDKAISVCNGGYLTFIDDSCPYILSNDWFNKSNAYSNEVQSIKFYSDGSSFEGTPKDISLNSDNSVLLYEEYDLNTNMYDLKISSNNKIYFPINSNYLFSSFQYINEIDFNNSIDTSQVTSMACMFYNIGYYAETFELDLSSFDTRKVENTSEMFYYSRLSKIYVGNNWDIELIIDDDDMFYGSTSLVGDRGTTYNWNHTDAEYARIDGDGGPGYLSIKNRGPYNITVTSDDTNKGTVFGSGTYDELELVELYAIQEEGYSFLGWYENDELISIDSDYLFKAINNRNIVGKFVKNKNVNLIVENPKHGRTYGSGEYPIGDEITISAMANAKYKFIGWYDGDTLISTDSDYTFIMSNSDVEYTAKFEEYDGPTWSIVKADGAGYGFIQNKNGYYESTNKEIDDSAAISVITVYVPDDNTTIDFHIINYAESGWDFGIIGRLDGTLASDNYEDLNAARSFKDFNQSNEQIYSFTGVSAGTHTIYIKYIKDGSVNLNNDSLQFKIGFDGSTPINPITVNMLANDWIDIAAEKTHYYIDDSIAGVQSITFYSNGSSFSGEAIDVSQAQDGSILLYYDFDENTEKFDLKICSNDIIYLPEDSSFLFEGFVDLINLDFNNSVDTSKVENMFAMFGRTGQNSENLELDLTDFDTSNVTDMSYMFAYSNNLSKIYVGENWNTDSVNSSDDMFIDDYSLLNYDSNSVNLNKATSICDGGYLTFVGETCINSLSRDWAVIAEIKENYDSEEEIDFIQSITFYSNGSSFSGLSWDISTFGDGSIILYAVLNEETGKYDLKICSDDKIYFPKNSSFLFAGFTDLVSLDFNNSIDTSNVANMLAMFGMVGQNSETLDLDLSEFDTSNVVDMTSMFALTGIQELNLSSFDTSNVINMSGMFAASKFHEIDISNFDTSKVTNMDAMFLENETLSKILVGENWNTDSVISSSMMFGNTYLLPNYDSYDVEVYMATSVCFGGYLTVVGDTCPNVLSTNWMIKSEMKEHFFDDIEIDYVQSITFYSNGSSFSGEPIDISLAGDNSVLLYYELDENTEKFDLMICSDDKIYFPTYSYFLFSGFSNLISIDFNDSIDTSKVTDMSYMFSGADIQELDISSFNTSNVIYMNDMFEESSIPELDLSNFDTSKVTDMSYMFSGADIQELDISSFDTSKVKYIYDMFYECNNLTKIYVGKNWNTDSVIEGNNMFDNCYQIIGNNGTIYDSENTDYLYARIDGDGGPGYLSIKNQGPYNVIVTSNDANKGTVSGGGIYDKFETVTLIAMPIEGYSFVGWYEDNKLISTSDNYSFKAVDDRNIVGEFRTLRTLTLANANPNYGSISGSGKYAEGSKVKITAESLPGYIFNGWYQNDTLISVKSNYTFTMPTSDITYTAKFDVYTGPTWSISKPFDADFGFVQNEDGYYESTNNEIGNSASVAIITVNVPNNNTTIDFHLINYAEPGYDYGIIGLLDGTLTTNNYEDTNVAKSFKNLHQSDEQIYSFTGVNTGTHTIYIKYRKDYSDNLNNDSLQFKIGFDGNEPIDSNKNNTLSKDWAVIVGLKEYYDSEEEIDFIQSITFYSNESSFSGGAIDVSENQDGSVLMYPELDEETGKFDLKICSDDTIKFPNDSSYLFAWFTDLISLDLNDSVDMSKVENMSGMFNMYGRNIESLELDLNNFDTSNVTNMEGMFAGTGIQKLDISSFDTSNVTNMSYMFVENENLTSILVGENWNTNSVTSSDYMFAGALSLPNYDEDINDVEAAISICDGGYLKVVGDICPNYLATEWGEFAGYKSSHDNVGGYMGIDYIQSITFYSNGSSFSGEPVDVSQAQDESILLYKELDEETDMLDLKICSDDIINLPSDSSYLFAGYTDLLYIDFNNSIDTSKVTNMSNMFYRTGLYSSNFEFDLKNFDTSNVTDMNSMLRETGANTENFELDLSSFDTSKVTDMTWMFEYDRSLTTIYVGDDWNTDSVIYDESMFEYCDLLVGENGTRYNENHIDKSYARIDGDGGPGYLTYISPGPFTINVSSNDTSKGTVSGNGIYDRLGIVTLIATPKSNYIFEGWYENNKLVSLENTYTFKAIKDRNIIGRFNIIRTLTLTNLNPDYGRIIGSGEYFEDSRVTIKAIPNSGYKFTGWYDGNTLISKNSEYSFTMSNSNVSYAARFEGYDGSTWLYETANGASYGFIQNENGYYESNNKGVHDSAAVTQITFDIFEDDTTIDFHVINYAETGWDFGIIGPLDGILTTDYLIDSNVSKSFKGLNKAGEQIYSITGVSAGTHTIYIKYRKNGSINANNDSLQFKIGFNGETPIDGSKINRLSRDWGILAGFKEEYNENEEYEEYGNENVQSITFYSNGSSFSGEAIDVSQAQDESIILYKVLNPETVKYDLKICSNDIIYFPEDSSDLFANYYYLNEFDFNDSIDTSGIINMKSMFYYTGYRAENIELDLDSFDTSKVTNMSYMFASAGYNSTTFKLDLSRFDTSKVTDMHMMFFNAGYNAVTWTVGDLSNWNTGNVTNMSEMFCQSGYDAVTWIVGDLSNWDTSKVTNMVSMFSNIGHNSTTLTIGNISNWNTSNVTNMSMMFNQFGPNSIALEIGNLSNWDTSKVTNMSYMFYKSGIVEFYLDSWDTSKVESMYQMFYSNKKLLKIYVGEKWNTDSVYSSSNMFTDCNLLVGGNGTIFDSSHVDKSYARIDGNGGPGYLTYLGPGPFNINVSSNDNNKGTVSGGGIKSKLENVTLIATPQPGNSLLGWYENNELVSSDINYSFIAIKDRNIVGKFNTSRRLTLTNANPNYGSISGSGTYAEGKEVTITAKPKLEYKFVGWYDGDTLVNNRKNYIFTMPSSDISYTAKFEEYTGPTWSMEKVNGTSFGFVINDKEYYESTNKKVSYSTAVSVITVYVPSSNTTIDFHVINYAEASNDFGIIGRLDGTLSTSYSEDTNVAKSFKNSNQPGEQIFSFTGVSAGIHTIYIKYRKNGSIDSNNDSLQFKIGFNGDEPIEALNMVSRDWGVKAGFKSSYDSSTPVSNVQSVTFYKDGTSFTGTPIDISQHQDGRILLYKELDTETNKYDLKIVSDSKIYFPKDSSYLFAYYSYLNDIDFNNSVDTSKVTNMSYLFRNTGINTNKFELDISDFDTNKVANMSYMFASSKLSKIIVTQKWSRLSVTSSSSSNMFSGATLLPNYNSNYVDISMAISVCNGGYFTYSGEICPNSLSKEWGVKAGFKSSYSSTTSINNVQSVTFYEDGSTFTGTPIDVSAANDGRILLYKELDTSTNRYDLKIVSNEKIYLPSDSSYLFASYYYLNNIDFNNSIDTSKVTSMSYMFYYTGYNAANFELDLSSFDTSKVTSMSYMFYYTRKLTKILVSESWNTTLVTSSTSMFSGATLLPNYNSSYVGISKAISVCDDGYLTFVGEVCNNYLSRDWSVKAGFKTSYSDGAAINDIQTITFYSNGSSFTGTPIDVSIANDGRILLYKELNSTTNKYDLKIVSNEKIYFPKDSSYLFAYYYYLNNIDFNNSIDTSEMTSMFKMFNYTGYNAANFELDLSSFDTSKVIDMSYMFNYAGYNSANFELDLSNWDTSKVTNMSYMFYYTRKLSRILVRENWNTASVTNSTSMFSGATSLVNYNSSYTGISRAISVCNDGYLTFAGEVCTNYLSRDWSVKTGFKTSYNSTTSINNVQSITFYSNGSTFTGTPIDVSQYADGRILLYKELNSTTNKYDLKIVSNEKIYFPENSAYLFAYYYYLNNIDFNESINTINVTSMADMFSNFGRNASNVELDLSSFDTSNVTNMSWMFYYTGYNASNLKLDLSSFDTSKVTNMSYMFASTAYGTSNFELDLSSFDTSKVLNMSSMFYNSNKLSKIYVREAWDTSTVTSSSNMFSGCSSIVGGNGTIYNSSYIDKTYARVDVNGSPGYLTYLGNGPFTINASSNNINKGTVSGSGTYDLREKVTLVATPAINNEFIGWYENNVLISSNATYSFKTTKDRNIVGKFLAYRTLTLNTSIIDSGSVSGNGTYLEGSEITISASENSGYRFRGWYDGETLLTKNYDYTFIIPDSNITYTALFEGYDGPTWTLDLIGDYDFVKNSNGYYESTNKGNISRNTAAVSVITVNVPNDNTTIDFHVINYTEPNNDFGIIGPLDGTLSLDSIEDANAAKSFKGLSSTEEQIYSFEGVSAGTHTIYIKYRKDDNGVSANRDSLQFKIGFNGDDPIEARKIITKNYLSRDWAVKAGLKTEYNSVVAVNDVQSITFYSNDSSFSGTPIDVSEYQDGKILLYKILDPITNKYDLMICSDETIYLPRNSSYLFAYYSYLNELDLNDSIDSSRTINMSYMFKYTGNKLSTFELDLKNLDTSKVTNMSYMFECAGEDAKSSILDISNFDTSKVTNMEGMFYYFGLDSTTIYVYGFDEFNTGNVTDMSNMFVGFCREATQCTIGDISGWNTSNVTDMWNMFHEFCRSTVNLKLDLSSWDVSKVTNMEQLFMYFGGQSKTVELDLTGWDTSNVLDMTRMFSGVGSNATTLIVKGVNDFKTGNVTNMDAMFENFGESLATFELDLSKWDTGNVTNMDGMFAYTGIRATTWTVGDINHWNTSKVTNMAWMFSGLAWNITNFELDLSGWDTSKVTNMSYMFQFTSEGLRSSFKLDLSGWDTSSVTDMTNMFYECTGLSKIYVGPNWSTASVVNSTTMFYQCISLVGGNGTGFSTGYTDKLYARVDGNGGKGYLTYRGPIYINAISNDTNRGVVSGGGTYYSSNSVTLTATPNENYQFMGWYENNILISSNSTYTFNAVNDRNIIGEFRTSRTVALTNANSDYGNISGGGTYPEGKQITINAIPNNGYKFTGWYDGDTLISVKRSYTFTVPTSDVSYTAKFEVFVSPTWTISTASGASYGFTKNANGYYESTNKGLNYSASVSVITVEVPSDDTTIDFHVINYAENNFDYGIIGLLDGTLTTDYNVDTNVAKSFKGLNQSGEQSYSFTNVSAGTHTIYVKYRKDSSNSNYNDSFQFKIGFDGNDPIDAS